MPRTILVSDQPVLLYGLMHVLETRGFETAACFGSGGLRVFLRTCGVPDLAVLDITGGVNFANLLDIHRKLPHCPVVLWADMLPFELLSKTLQFGVRGIVRRKCQPEQLSDSLRRICNGEMQLGFGGPYESAPPLKKVSLSPRERDIVQRLRRGLRNRQIAAEMNIAEGTVKICLFRLFRKLGVRNRLELASFRFADSLQWPRG